MAVKKHRSTIFFVKRSLESAVASAWTAVTGSHRLVAVAVVGVVGGLAGAAYVVLLRLLSDLVWSADRPLAGQAVVLLGAAAILAVAAKVARPTGDVELLVYFNQSTSEHFPFLFYSQTLEMADRGSAGQFMVQPAL